MDYRQAAINAANRYGIPSDLFLRQIQQESGFNPSAVSSAGAIGLGQLMPETARELGVDPNDPLQNLDGAARYMSQQLRRFKNPALALAAYNAGPSRVVKANGIPDIAETKNYVSAILGEGDMNMNGQQPMTPNLSFSEEDFAKQEKSAKRKDMAGAFASWLNSMSINPDPNLPQVVQAAQARRADQLKNNRTVNMLEEAGRDDIAKLVKTGVITGKEGAAQLFAEANAVRAQKRAMELAEFEAGLKPTKMFEYQSLAKDLLERGVAKTKKEALQMAMSYKKSGPTVSVSYGKEGGPPKAFETVDKEFAKEAVKWSSGGAADATKNINQIREVISDINLATTEGRTPSGPLVGIQNDLVQSFLNPEATDIRNRVQEVVQRNLREILGAQFTQAEGLALIERAYNQRLSPEMNLRRLNALLEQMATSATAKQQMYEYFMNEGTLFGYRAEATLPTLDELHGLMDTFDQQDGIDTSYILDEAKKKQGTYDFSTADLLAGVEEGSK